MRNSSNTDAQLVDKNANLDPANKSLYNRKQQQENICYPDELIDNNQDRNNKDNQEDNESELNDELIEAFSNFNRNNDRSEPRSSSSESATESSATDSTSSSSNNRYRQSTNRNKSVNTSYQSPDAVTIGNLAEKLNNLFATQQKLNESMQRSFNQLLDRQNQQQQYQYVPPQYFNQQQQQQQSFQHQMDLNGTSLMSSQCQFQMQMQMQQMMFNMNSMYRDMSAQKDEFARMAQELRGVSLRLNEMSSQQQKCTVGINTTFDAAGSNNATQKSINRHLDNFRPPSSTVLYNSLPSYFYNSKSKQGDSEKLNEFEKSDVNSQQQQQKPHVLKRNVLSNVVDYTDDFDEEEDEKASESRHFFNKFNGLLF
jgi:hypothetical protein